MMARILAAIRGLWRRHDGTHARIRGDFAGWFEQTPTAPRPRIAPWKPRAVPDAPAARQYRAPEDTVVDGLLGYALRCLTCDIASLDALRNSYARHIDRQVIVAPGYDNEALIVPFGSR